MYTKSVSSVKAYQSINCRIYDHIEMVCLYQYEIEITLIDDSVLIGKAINTKSDTEKIEYLVVKTQFDNQLIRLDTIKSISVITQNAVFDQIRFDIE